MSLEQVELGELHEENDPVSAYPAYVKASFCEEALGYLHKARNHALAEGERNGLPYGLVVLDAHDNKGVGASDERGLDKLAYFFIEPVFVEPAAYGVGILAVGAVDIRVGVAGNGAEARQNAYEYYQTCDEYPAPREEGAVGDVQGLLGHHEYLPAAPCGDDRPRDLIAEGGLVARLKSFGDIFREPFAFPVRRVRGQYHAVIGVGEYDRYGFGILRGVWADKRLQHLGIGRKHKMRV